jgi:hypothetical protein
MKWAADALRSKKTMPPAPPSPKEDEATASKAQQAPGNSTDMETIMSEWLEREDEDDDVFLQQLEDATLDKWDHRTHLRIAWLLLGRHGRREGMKRIFDGIKSFIERSPRTQRKDAAMRGITFHETMTYFCVHTVSHLSHQLEHQQMVSKPRRNLCSAGARKSMSSGALGSVASICCSFSFVIAGSPCSARTFTITCCSHLIITL